uniref:Uncharacterized protein n=1 Tax=Rhizophora mucronata TaxID=61149 RepID=A0A2P2MX63_RHIMU
MSTDWDVGSACILTDPFDVVSWRVSSKAGSCALALGRQIS